MAAQRSEHGQQRVPVAEAVGRTLAAAGVGHVFGVVGSGNFHMTNALVDSGVGFTATRHEMGAATMADAYSRATGEVSVVSLHQGCGFTNSLTGVTEAAKCHTPMVVLTGDTAAGDTTSNFVIDQDAAAAAIGAVPMRVHSAATAIADAARAVEAARRRQTVVLSVPVDVQEELVDWAPELVPATPPTLPAGASGESVSRLVELLAGASRPVLVAGRGAWHAKAAIARLGEAAGALLITSAAARGLFVGEEWALDVMGGFSTEGAADLVRSADVLVGFGVALNEWTTRQGTLLADKTVVQVDDRPAAIGRVNPVDLAVIGDAALVADEVAAALETAGPARVGYRTPEVGARVAEVRYWVDQPFEPAAAPGTVDPVELVAALDALLPDERVVVPDGGNVNCYAGAYLRVPDQRGYCIPLSFQAIGMGLAAAIGAGVAQPERMPVLGTGDGAFMMSLVELDTAVRLGMGMLVVVFDDAAYGAEVHLFGGIEDRNSIVHFPDTDLAAIARGYGCEGVVVRSLDDLGPLHEWLAGPRDRPFVIDAKIDGAPSFMMRRRFEGGGGGH